MTGRKNADRAALDRLADFLVEDVLATPDDEILAELQDAGINAEGDAARMHALFDQVVLAANKKRLQAAKAAVQTHKSTQKSAGTLFDIQAARRRIRSALEQKGTLQRLTLAARKENELSDADILSMAQDLDELGLLPPDNK
jgi:hypothetical protein